MQNRNNVMSVSPPPGFSWFNYHCFTSFDALIENFVCGRESWLLKTPESIDAGAAIREIRERYVDSFDEGKETFDEKAQKQFAGASRNAKLFFIHVEYLWAMPSGQIGVPRKREYALRWFTDAEIRDDENAYFGSPHIIANPGPHYQNNKYFEIRAMLRVLSQVFLSPAGKSAPAIKAQIWEEAYNALHVEDSPPLHGFPVTGFCGVHPALLHLCDPERSEAIISRNHRESILGVFAHVIADRDDISCPEQRIKLIRERLYHNYYSSHDPVRKYRWFFYIPEVKSPWIDKKGKLEGECSCIQMEIQEEESAYPLEDDEGNRIETNGTRLQRSAALVKAVKERDTDSCLACGFSYRKKIVHVHHLDPLAERKKRTTKQEDLITLCPNCHYLAHHFLRDKKCGDTYKIRATLLAKLESVVR